MNNVKMFQILLISVTKIFQRLILKKMMILSYEFFFENNRFKILIIIPTKISFLFNQVSKIKV